MRITQGCFSFLPDLTDDQIRAQVQYCIDHGWAVNIEFTDDPHPRNTCWEMWGLPMFDIQDAAAVMMELADCPQSVRRPVHPYFGLRFESGLGIGEALLHRQSAAGGAGFSPGRSGNQRPQTALYTAPVCH